MRAALILLSALVRLALVAGSFLLVSPGSAQVDLDRLKRATVFLYQARSEAENLIVTCVSSGTLISADGLIVTNAHGAMPGRQCAGDVIIVALNVDLDEPPIPKYRAEIAGAAENLDIALLRITRELDGRLIARDSLPVLPYVEVGDSSQVEIDDNLLMVGYPELGNQAVSVERGTVIAFIAEPVAGGVAWFKTRAELPGTMAGGGAYDSSGRLVGIPANAPIAGNADNCRYISDTNGDSLVNSSDACVPIGDFISAIRPAHLAQSAIRGARLELEVGLVTASADAPDSRQAPVISRLFFASAVTDGMPSTVVPALPANTRALYLFFDYANMSPEAVYELRVTRDGVPDSVFSLPPLRWSGGESGLWHIGAREQAWANGAYEFTLLVDGASAGSRQIVIGGGTASRGRLQQYRLRYARPRQSAGRQWLDCADRRYSVGAIPVRRHAARRVLGGDMVL